jgi:hypothetical protein
MVSMVVARRKRGREEERKGGRVEEKRGLGIEYRLTK